MLPPKSRLLKVVPLDHLPSGTGPCPSVPDQPRHLDSNVSGDCDGNPSDQPAVEQAAQPPARPEHHILEAGPDIDTDVDGVAESRRPGAAPPTTMAASLALEIGDRDVDCPNNRCADDDFWPATVADGPQKRPRRGDTLEDIDDDVDKPACGARRRLVKWRARPPRPRDKRAELRDQPPRPTPSSSHTTCDGASL